MWLPFAYDWLWAKCRISHSLTHSLTHFTANSGIHYCGACLKLTPTIAWLNTLKHVVLTINTASSDSCKQGFMGLSCLWQLTNKDFTLYLEQMYLQCHPRRRSVFVNNRFFFFFRFIYCHTIHSDKSYYRSTTDHIIKTSKETHLIQNYLETNIPNAWDCCNICIYCNHESKQTKKKSIINTFVSSFPIRKSII